MAITDLIAKLVLDSSDWSSDLKKSSRELKAFQDGVKNAGDFLGNLSGSLASTAAKFAGWAGAGLAAKEGLEKFLRAGQTTSDWLDREMASWSGLFDEFFRSLNNGSVSGFLANMAEVKNAIEEATRAADSFNDARASMNVISLKYDVQQRQILEQIKRNKNNPELVKTLKEQLRQLESQRKKDLADVVSQKGSSFNADFNAIFQTPMASGVEGLGSYSLRKILRLQSTGIDEFFKIMSSEVAGTFDKAVAEAQKLAKKTVGIRDTYTYDIHGQRIYTSEQYEPTILSDKEIEDFKKTWGFSVADILYYNELVDTQRNKLKKSLEEYYNLQRSQFEFNERNTEIFNMGTTGGGGSGNLSKVYAAGSLGWYSQQIAALVEKQNNITDANELQRLQIEIDRLKLRKETIEISVRLAGGLKGTIPSKIGGVNATIKAENAIMPTGGGLPFVGDNAVNQVVSLEQGLGGVAEMLRTISGLTNEGTQAWLNYASNALSAMRGLMIALQSVGMANAASQSAAAGPFGWMQVPIAIASMLAAFASIPKFSRGGIVPGNSYSGDKVLAGLNSREMVLTQSQQSKLFAMLNGASIASGGSVEFEIRADKLVGVLDNYNRRRRKIV